MMGQQSIDKETEEAARRILEAICDANLANASFAAKQEVITKLGIRVYPSEDEKVVRVVLRLDLGPRCRVSPHIISMASPKL